MGGAKNDVSDFFACAEFWWGHFLVHATKVFADLRPLSVSMKVSWGIYELFGTNGKRVALFLLIVGEQAEI